MKGFLLFLNALVFACVVLLAVAHLRHRPPPPPAILAARPAQPSTNPAGLLDGRVPRPAVVVAAISKDDLFDPQRGEVAAVPAEKTAAVTDAQRKKLEQLELLGIVRMGGSHGAIIHDRSGKLKKRYFTVGGPDDIEGFKLVAVDPDANQVTLGAGGREYELKLDRNSKASIQRRAQAERQEAIVTLSPTPTPASADGAAEAETGGQRPGGDRAAAVEQARQRMEAIRRERAARQAQGGQDGSGDGGILPPGMRRRAPGGEAAESPRK